MRKHVWQLPYHPLQVVVVAVFLALGFAFYMFFAPFVGKKMYRYIAITLYTLLEFNCLLTGLHWGKALETIALPKSAKALSVEYGFDLKSLFPAMTKIVGTMGPKS